LTRFLGSSEFLGFLGDAWPEEPEEPEEPRNAEELPTS
jgi:hypothetical protein